MKTNMQRETHASSLHLDYSYLLQIEMKEWAQVTGGQGAILPGYPAARGGKVHGFLSYEVTLVPGLPRPVVQQASRIIAQAMVGVQPALK